MRELTKSMWDKQNQHDGDRQRLFTSIAGWTDAERVLYPGSFVDIAASMAFPHVTYLDSDKRAKKFFSDTEGVAEIIDQEAHTYDFISGDYTKKVDLPEQSFDLLVSLYAGFVSEHCTQFLKIGGHLLVNPSHGDASMASIDERYDFRGVVVHRESQYSVSNMHLENYFIPRKPVEITVDYLHTLGRGVGYTRTPFAYMFERTS